MEIIGYIAAFFTTASMLPQVIKTIKSKSAGDLSFTMIVFLFTGVVLWFVYGLLVNQMPIIIANALTGILVGILLVYKFFIDMNTAARDDWELKAINNMVKEMHGELNKINGK